MIKCILYSNNHIIKVYRCVSVIFGNWEGGGGYGDHRHDTLPAPNTL